MKYYVSRGLRFTVTRSFVNVNDAEANIKECNAYLEEHPDEGVIWSSDDNTIIIIANKKDKGTPLALPAEEVKYIQASPLHIREGATIFVYGDDNRYHEKKIVTVLNPYDLWKAYLADDGCRYGLDGSFVSPA